MKNILAIGVLIFMLFGCKKEINFTITIYNPESIALDIRSEDFIGGFVQANTEETFTGYLKGKNTAGLTPYGDPYGTGEYTQYGSDISFGVGDGGSFYHVLGSGTFTKL
jgi:hypothetical protein